MAAINLLIIVAVGLEEARGDVEEDAAPFVVDALRLVQNLVHAGLVFGVDIDDTG